MKKNNYKKIIIIIVCLLVVAGLIFLLVNTVMKKEKKATEEETKVAENMSIRYITNLTYGVGTVYNGLDILFEKDKLTYDDLNVGEILTVAYNYAIDNEKINTTVPDYVMNEVGKSFNLDEFSVIPGESIRTAIKELFGVDFKDQSYLTPINFNYMYRYVPQQDVYLRGYMDLKIDTENYNVDYKSIKTTAKGDKLFTEIAVAYVYKNDNKYYYTKDSANNDVIYETSKREFKDEDKFTHYKITLKKVNNNYVFESIEKIK